MAHIRSLPDSCEIIEIDDDELFMPERTRHVNHSRSEMKMEDGDRRSMGSNLGRRSSFEDDLNQLFEIFNCRASAQLRHSHLAGAGTCKLNSTTKFLGSSGSSPRSGVSNGANLKQALRGLCISQASEMAAMRRSARSGPSSDSRRIMSMYRSVVVEDAKSVVPNDTLAANQSVLPMQGGEISYSNERASQASMSETPEIESPLSSPSPIYPSPPTCASSTSSIAICSMKKIGKNSPTEKGPFSSLAELAHQTSITGFMQKEQQIAPIPSSASPSNVADSKEHSNDANDLILTSRTVDGQEPQKEFLHKVDQQPLPSYHHNDVNDILWDFNGCSPSGRPMRKESTEYLAKPEQKGSALKAGQKKSMECVPSGSLIKGNKASKNTRNALYFVKPVIKTKSVVRRKTRKSSIPYGSSNGRHTEVNKGMHPGPSQIVCPRCQCIVTDALKDANRNSLLSAVASNGTEVNTGNVASDAGALHFTSEGLQKYEDVLDTEDHSKSRNKSEFTQSSISSTGNCSSSTNISEESRLSRPSYCDRPHRSKDVRWEAICIVKMQHGALELGHFNLLKKLGSGDIGTVYLAELIGTNCLFAIKVMDNEFLFRRKKIARAQTEREILRMLDHPFLPTLYSQFTCDNLSCLVMEYCPGGDLHVLRQKQSGRCFTEQAARFYVAEVLLALEYLHMLGVVYRDLKPENILVREDGHIMLSDFDLSLRCAVNPMLLVSSSSNDTTDRVSGPSTDSGCAQPFCVEPSCQVSCFSPRLLSPGTKQRKTKPDPAEPSRPLPLLVAEPTTARSNSFVGTHEYLAPEIINGEGHGSAVDWWTLGIFLYELLYGRTPFKGSGNEETLANVVLEPLKFPDSPLVSLHARHLIAALLVKEPENRLGTERGAAEIKQHPFFDGLNWALIRCTPPPQLPEPRDFGFTKVPSPEKGDMYLEYKGGNGEHLEFEVF